GVNVFDREALAHIEPDEALGIPEFIGRLLEAGRHVAGFRNAAQWLDIGRPEDYQTAQDIFADPRRRRRYLRGERHVR
ncbi:MAG: nucleotidyltransferase family protein, partial [Elusimicrobia bacterium]|nr:nucleotidyltransferase family protein [Elusimicrobiota bacterium]